ncbi:MAG: hypothetical protein R3B89_21295 [Polyangiaceae bacterium]
MAAPKLHPAVFWLPVVAGLVLALGWVLLRDPSPPNPSEPGRSAPDATDRVEEQPATAVTRDWNAVAPSNPAPLPAEDASGPPDIEGAGSDDPAVMDSPAAKDALSRARQLLEQKRYSEARQEALACLKADPGNTSCQRARVHTYTRQYSMGETKNILGWCLSAYATDLDCLRAMREFHTARGERMDASGISAEIRERFPDADLTMSPLPGPGAAPPSEAADPEPAPAGE